MSLISSRGHHEIFKLDQPKYFMNTDLRITELENIIEELTKRLQNKLGMK